VALMLLVGVYLVYAILLSVGLWRAGLRSGPAAAQPASPAADRFPMRVLVVGGTGGTGRQLVTQALERGCRVTVLVRNPAKLRVQHAQLHVVPGDVLDAAAVSAALRDQDAVLCALGHKRYLGPSRILSDGTRNILRGMQEHGVRRLVCETSLGIGQSAGRLGLWYTLFVIPVILPFYFWDKTRQERAIAASAVEWVIVRPGALTNAGRTGRMRHGTHVGSVVATVRIGRADVAAFMLQQLESDVYVGRAAGVCW
jgi:nucleoside-diphosphate-sugar epimerase